MRQVLEPVVQYSDKMDLLFLEGRRSYSEGPTSKVQFLPLAVLLRPYISYCHYGWCLNNPKNDREALTSSKTDRNTLGIRHCNALQELV